MTHFEKALLFTLGWEGGYVNDPHDPGGETKYGITKRSYPDLDIKNLTREQAEMIYKQDYWEKAKCDKMPWPMSLVHFDACVNMGITRATRIKEKSISSPDVFTLAINMIAARNNFYQGLANKRPDKFKRYLKGWLNRTGALQKLVIKEMRKP